MAAPTRTCGCRVALEALLWTVVPPVDETFGFVEDAIEKELDWLNAPPGSRSESASTPRAGKRRMR